MFKFFKNKGIELKSPFEGKIVDITEVNDQAFSSRMLGDGAAVIPTSKIATAPCDGEIAQIFPTNHAFGLVTKEGIEILVHIGLDTVELKGQGFKRLVEVGAKVKKGDNIIEVDFDYIKECGKDKITPIVITNMDKVEKLEKNFNNPDNILKIT